jgi:hypothetical protein
MSLQQTSRSLDRATIGSIMGRTSQPLTRAAFPCSSACVPARCRIDDHVWEILLRSIRPKHATAVFRTGPKISPAPSIARYGYSPSAGQVRHCRFYAVDGITGWGGFSRYLLNGWSCTRRPTMPALVPGPHGPATPSRRPESTPRPRWARLHPRDEASCIRNGSWTGMITASPCQRPG